MTGLCRGGHALGSQSMEAVLLPSLICLQSTGWTYGSQEGECCTFLFQR